MPISKEQVERIARLARLNLTSSEVAQYTRELTLILDYIGQLEAIDTSVVDLERKSAMPRQTLRRDEISPSLPRVQALANAPKSDGEFFRVPKVLDR